ncbi:hypothetical protein V2J09_019877 [Rumex salicifolius]
MTDMYNSVGSRKQLAEEFGLKLKRTSLTTEGIIVVVFVCHQMSRTHFLSLMRQLTIPLPVQALMSSIPLCLSLPESPPPPHTNNIRPNAYALVLCPNFAAFSKLSIPCCTFMSLKYCFYFTQRKDQPRVVRCGVELGNLPFLVGTRRQDCRSPHIVGTWQENQSSNYLSLHLNKSVKEEAATRETISAITSLGSDSTKNFKASKDYQ